MIRLSSIVLGGYDEHFHENNGFSCRSISGAAFAADEDRRFDWAGYEDPNFFSNMLISMVMPTYSFFSDEEEAFQKIVLGSKPISAIHAHSL